MVMKMVAMNDLDGYAKMLAVISVDTAHVERGQSGQSSPVL